MDLRKIIVAEADRQGLSQAELARRAGLPQPTVNVYFTGRNDLAGTRVGALMKALGLKVDRRAKRTAPRD